MIVDDKVRAAMRKKLHTEVEFYVDADIIKANSLDVSDTGIKFETDVPIKVRMRVDMGNNEFDEHEAELVWAQKEENGLTTYGLHFLPDGEDVIESTVNDYTSPEDTPGEWE